MEFKRKHKQPNVRHSSGLSFSSESMLCKIIWGESTDYIEVVQENSRFGMAYAAKDSKNTCFEFIISEYA